MIFVCSRTFSLSCCQHSWTGTEGGDGPLLKRDCGAGGGGVRCPGPLAPSPANPNPSPSPNLAALHVVLALVYTLLPSANPALVLQEAGHHICWQGISEESQTRVRGGALTLTPSRSCGLCPIPTSHTHVPLVHMHAACRALASKPDTLMESLRVSGIFALRRAALLTESWCSISSAFKYSAAASALALIVAVQLRRGG